MKLELIDESIVLYIKFINDESFNGGFMTEAENVFPWVISIFLHGY